MRAVNLTAAALIAMPLAALAQDQSPQQGTTTSTQRLEEGQTSSSCIKNITFSQEFLTRYPNAGAACREVKVEDGVKWARFDADVARRSGNQVTANFVDTFNRKLAAITFEATPDARVEVNGRPVPFRGLRVGDRLSFWMPESRVGFYAEPGTSESDKLTVVSNTPAQR
jgi:hypothetical protein